MGESLDSRVARLETRDELEGRMLREIHREVCKGRRLFTRVRVLEVKMSALIGLLTLGLAPLLKAAWQKMTHGNWS